MKIYGTDLRSVWMDVTDHPGYHVPEIEKELKTVLGYGMPFKPSFIDGISADGDKMIRFSFDVPFRKEIGPPIIQGNLILNGAPDTNSLIIEELYVNDEWRGLGFAKQVTSNIFNLAQDVGYDGVRCLAGKSHGVAFWPRFMRIHEHDAVVANGWFGRDKDYYDGDASFKEKVLCNLKRLKESIESEDSYFVEGANIDFSKYKLEDIDDLDWIDRLYQYHDDHQHLKMHDLLDLRLSSPMKANMITDFLNPQDVARSKRFFDIGSRPDRNLDYLTRLNGLVKESRSLSI